MNTRAVLVALLVTIAGCGESQTKVAESWSLFMSQAKRRTPLIERDWKMRFQHLPWDKIEIGKDDVGTFDSIKAKYIGTVQVMQSGSECVETDELRFGYFDGQWKFLDGTATYRQKDGNEETKAVTLGEPFHDVLGAIFTDKVY
jgi:hypothetical protein